jgi:hypothetical protein
MEEELKLIARRHFGVKSLRITGNDDRDMYNAAIWEIKGALVEAYKAGMEMALRAKPQPTKARR